MKNNNWLNDFVESYNKKRDIRTSNKKYLNRNELRVIVEHYQREFYFLEKKLGIMFDLVQEQREHIKEFKKVISSQKGRITRQTNEQNVERKAIEKDLFNIYVRLGTLEVATFEEVA